MVLDTTECGVFNTTATFQQKMTTIIGQTLFSILVQCLKALVLDTKEILEL